MSRVPGLAISLYARKGYIDHQTLSHDAYIKFIGDVFLDGARVDPKTDGRPDPHTHVRENVTQLGDLRTEFDFSGPPGPLLILPGGIEALHGGGVTGRPQPFRSNPMRRWIAW